MSMLRILGNNRKLCDGISRRDLIQAGALSLFGVTLDQVFALHAAQAASGSPAAPRSFGKAQTVLILYLYGTPGQLDTGDMKHDGPEETCGPVKPVRTSSPGIEICEHMPRVARWMHRVSTVRTMTHEYPIHGVAYALTGSGATDLAMETNARDPRHWPYFGSVVDYVETTARRRQGLPGGDLPNNVLLPHRFGRPGPQPQWLGTAWAPAVTSWKGKSTGADPYGQGRENPYGGITPDTRFRFTERAPEEGITLDRLQRRRSLL